MSPPSFPLLPKPVIRPQGIHFSSGPCAKRPGWSPQALSGALVGRSHRSSPGKARLEELLDRSRTILGLPKDWRIGIVPGSDTGAVEMAMWSLLGPRGVEALGWESFGLGWITDITKQLRLKDVTCRTAPYGQLPDLRKVDFTQGGQNFVLVLSPGLIDKAPHSFMATVRVDGGDENAMYNRITDQYPGVSTVRVKDAIAQVDVLLQQLATGISAASLVTILAGLLVLAGTIAAGARTRLYDATVLKVVGATRTQIALVYIAEYGFLGVATGIIALGAGSLAAAIAAKQILNISFVFDGNAALLTVVGGGTAALLFGLIGALAALRARPAARLRNG